MKILYLRNREIDKSAWNKSLERSANGLIYASSWYLDTVCKNKWDALVSENYEWIMPLTLKKKWGFTYLPTPYFVQQLGIFGPAEINTEIIKQFLDALPKHIKLIEYQFNYANNKLIEIRIAAEIRKNLVLHKNVDAAELQKELYNSNTQRNIKKAEKENLFVAPCKPEEILALFKQDKGQELKQLKKDWYALFPILCEQVKINAALNVYGVYEKEDKLIAGIVVFVFSGRHTLIFTGNSSTGKSTAAMPFLIDYYLKNMPINELFDFEGSDNQNLALFYKGFGAIESNYLHLKINNLPFWLKWIKK